jgi:RNA polymerase sigma-70 factor (ECF subfamily)
MEATIPDLDALLHQVRRRDSDAATRLVERLYPVVMAVVHRRRPRNADPEDMAQEVFLKLFAGLPAYRGGGASLEAWARRIAFTTCLNQIRHEQRRPELRWTDLTEPQAATLEALSADDSNATAADTVAARDLVQVLLNQLPAPERLLLELIDLEQRPLDEVRTLTGWSAVNIRVRCFRARRRLRRLLQRLQPHHEPRPS